MATHVLIINRQLSFAVSLKQALERTGKFQVHPFTSVDAALDYLKDHPQDVGLIDFNGISGQQVIEQLREIQPNLPIIASPKLPESESLALRLHATLDSPFKPHEVMALIGNAAEQTRRFPNQHQEMDSVLPTSVLPQTNHLDDDTLDQPVQTSQLISPGKAPEFSSLDNVLANMADPLLFEPSLQQGDTPALPFDAILETLDPSATLDELKRPDSQQFDELVNSMRPPESPRSVRDQQFVEFILAGGMDSLLSEIGRPKEAEDAPEEVPSSFERLAAEEPPMPSLEDSGTVGDLMLGVSDNSFRNVLSLLRGEEPSEAQRPPPAPGISHEEMAEAFASFYEQTSEDQPAEQSPGNQPREVSPRAAGPYDFESDSALSQSAAEPPEGTIPAQVILTSALDDTHPFSLDELIKGIERQLPTHRPSVRPLPSWKEQLPLRAAPDEDKYVREPDFLPEELPTTLEPMDYTGRFADQTTRGLLQQTAGPSPQDLETELLRLFEQPVSPPQTLPETPAEREQQQPVETDTFTQPASTPPEMTTEAYSEADFPADTQYTEEPEAAWETEVQPQEESANLVEEQARPSEFPETDWASLPSEDLAESAADEWPKDIQITEEEAPVDENGSSPFSFGDGEEEAFRRAETPGELAFASDFERLAALEFAGDENLEKTPVIPMAAMENPYIAQLALSLTQVSLELTADATLLTRDSDIIAYAGRMSREDIEEIRGIVNNDWNADPDQARIRFITLPSSGKDYMLYSRATVEDLTLSMIFAGTMPLRDIRRQGKRLIEALVAVPENPLAPDTSEIVIMPTPEAQSESAAVAAASEPMDVGPLLSYTYVWLLRDPNAHLNPEVSQAITTGLQVQLKERAWQIRSLEAREDYVYVVADIPGETPAPQIVRELKRRSADIAHAQKSDLNPEDLWSDSYLIVTPGRDLAVEEIQQFINFERM